MNTQQLFEEITEKWGVKVICFVVALILYAWHLTAGVEKKSFLVPLSVKDDGATVCVGITNENGAEISSVRIVVRADAEDIAKIEARKSSIQAYADISKFASSGKAKVPVFLDLPADVQLIEPLEITSEPEAVFVEMEKRLSRYVPILPSITGDVDRGYVQSSLSVVPNSVFISGPESIVSETENLITEEIDLSDHLDSFSTKTRLLNLNKKISVQEPPEITVSVGITAIKDLKLFSAVPVQFIGVRNELKIAEKSANQSVSVNLSGNLLFLENLPVSRILARADCSKITQPGEYDIALSISVPSGAVNADKENRRYRRNC